MGRIHELLASSLRSRRGEPESPAPEIPDRTSEIPDRTYKPPSNPVETLADLTIPIDWRYSEGRLELRRDNRVWFYLDGGQWWQGGTRRVVVGLAYKRLWQLYNKLQEEEAEAAEKAVLESVWHFSITRSDRE